MMSKCPQWTTNIIKGFAFIMKKVCLRVRQTLSFRLFGWTGSQAWEVLTWRGVEKQKERLRGNDKRENILQYVQRPPLKAMGIRCFLKMGSAIQPLTTVCYAYVQTGDPCKHSQLRFIDIFSMHSISTGSTLTVVRSLYRF